ncbi:MAG: hypothetical protein M3373_05595, partial [Gemmatimonadota bacterium]|nr:hypothetical protein [Gemmatimonadota bacterium]
MALWNKVRQELDRAGRVAQDALDEGKVRLDAMRARNLADKAAQALGYAVYRARQQGQEIDSDTYARLSSTLAAHEAEVTRDEGRLEDIVEARKTARPAGAGGERGSAGGEAADMPPR